MGKPEELTTITSRGEKFLIRAEPAGLPQGVGMASQTATLLSLTWRRLVRGERGWRLRVRRFADDPTGPILYEEEAASAEEAARRLHGLITAMRSGDWPWENIP
ncbi:MAG: hypothetical protein M3P53_08790 [Actinomycetota bacterium]|nr:hypothetical protein [Actinomycetota bacterium]